MKESSRGTVTPGQLMDEILAMPEYKLRQQLLGFNTSIYIFDQNFLELHRLINFLLNTQEGQLLTAARNKDKLEQVQIDVIRRLHNFVAASLSLIDHTRRLYNKLYKENGIFPEYQARVDTDFKIDPLAQFVKCLRQYCQHYKAPDIGIKVSVTQDQNGMVEERKSILLLDDLKAFDGWNAEAKEYMNSLKEDVDILEVTALYREKVIEFYRWFQSRQLEIHAAELDRFNTKQTEFALLLLEGNIDACLANKENMPYRGEEIFLGIFSSEDFEGVEKLPSNSTERAIYSVETLEKYYPVPYNLKQKIYTLYKEPGFFATRIWSNEFRDEDRQK